jgi:hypothetical protein
VQKPPGDIFIAETAREFARHTLAATAYRASKVLRDAPASFGSFLSHETSRTPSMTLAHMGDLFDWALTMVSGKPAWRDSEPLEWTQRDWPIFLFSAKVRRIFSVGTRKCTLLWRCYSKARSPTRLLTSDSWLCYAASRDVRLAGRITPKPRSSRGSADCSKPSRASSFKLASWSTTFCATFVFIPTEGVRTKRSKAYLGPSRVEGFAAIGIATLPVVRASNLLSHGALESQHKENSPWVKRCSDCQP